MLPFLGLLLLGRSFFVIDIYFWTYRYFARSAGVCYELFLNKLSKHSDIYICGYNVFVLITSLIQISTNNRQDSIQTRNMLSFIKILMFAVILLILFRHSSFVSYMPFAALLFAMLSAYIFTLLKNNLIPLFSLCSVR